jgi:hypothetical protein
VTDVAARPVAPFRRLVRPTAGHNTHHVGLTDDGANAACNFKWRQAPSRCRGRSKVRVGYRRSAESAMRFEGDRPM